MGKERLRCAVVGLGVGRRHAKSYADIGHADLVAVCDIQPALALEAARLHACEPFVDAAEMFDHVPLDAVSICTPPRSHADLTLAAISHKFHVLVEKPMSPSLDDCVRMIEAAESAGVTLMLGHRKRFAPPFVRLYDLTAEDGLLGHIRQVSARYMWNDIPTKSWFWRHDDGGGPLLDSHVHVADTLGFLLGTPLRVQVESAAGFQGGEPGTSALVT